FAASFTREFTRVNESVGTFTIPVTLNGTSESPVMVSYRATDETAQAGIDYEVEGTTLMFMPGESSGLLPITILPDAVDEPDETFVIELVSASAGVGFEQRTNRIVIFANSAPGVGFETDSSSASESETWWIPIGLSEPSSEPVTVAYSVG